MRLLTVALHGVTGTWLDEIVELGIPLVVLVILYFWSNRNPPKEKTPKEKPK